MNGYEALGYAIGNLQRQRYHLDHKQVLNRHERGQARQLGEALDALTHLRDLLADPVRLAEAASGRVLLDELERQFTRNIAEPEIRQGQYDGSTKCLDCQRTLGEHSDYACPEGGGTYRGPLYSLLGGFIAHRTSSGGANATR